MMTLLSLPPSRLSGLQRRCQLLLMLYRPAPAVTPEALASINRVNKQQALQDIADTADEIQRYHRLSLVRQPDGGYQLEGAELDRRLCLFHWLRRSLRLCPQFIQHQFTPAFKTWFKQQKILQTLYDDTNLQALVNQCARRLQRQYHSRDCQLLALLLPYCLYRHQLGISPALSAKQKAWIQLRPEYTVAQEVTRHWRRLAMRPASDDEQHFLALLLQLLRIPDPLRDEHEQDQRLRRAVAAMISRFRQLSGMAFSHEQGLGNRLYIHLAQALDRCLFDIAIDTSLTQEIPHLYPRLQRTTQDVLREFATHYEVNFSDAETCLVTVIFGAWLMQEHEMQEKQVLLLTANEPAQEQQIERQLRELTLLPLNIKYLTVQQFQRTGAPPGILLVVTPHATSLPLFSPPLLHVTLPLSPHQQQRMKAMLEA